MAGRGRRAHRPLYARHARRVLYIIGFLFIHSFFTCRRFLLRMLAFRLSSSLPVRCRSLNFVIFVCFVDTCVPETDFCEILQIANSPYLLYMLK